MGQRKPNKNEPEEPRVKYSWCLNVKSSPELSGLAQSEPTWLLTARADAVERLRTVKTWQAEGKSATRTFELCGIDVCVLESSSSTTSGYHHLIAGWMSFHHKIQRPVKDMEAPLGKKQLFLHTKVLKHKKLLGEVWLPGWRRKQSPLPPARLIAAFSTAFSATTSVKLQEVLQHVGRNFTTALLEF